MARKSSTTTPPKATLTADKKAEMAVKFAMNALEPLIERAGGLGWMPIKPGGVMSKPLALLSGVASDHPEFLSVAESAVEMGVLLMFPGMSGVWETVIHDGIDIMTDAFRTSITITDDKKVQDLFLAKQIEFRDKVTTTMQAAEQEKKRQEANTFGRLEASLNKYQRHDLLTMELWLAQFWPEGAKRWDTVKHSLDGKKRLEFMLSMELDPDDDQLISVPETIPDGVPNQRRFEADYRLMTKRLRYVESVQPKNPEPGLDDLKKMVLEGAISLLRGETPPQLVTLQKRIENGTARMKRNAEAAKRSRRLRRRRSKI